MIQAPVRALDPAAHGHGLDLLPGLGARQGFENLVVIWQAAARDLVPTLAPKRDGRLEFVATTLDEQVGVQQLHYLQRHERQAAQVAVGRRHRVWKIVHP